MLDPTSGYGLIEWVQSFSGPFLDTVFTNATRLGNEPFYWVFLPLLYWLGDRRKVVPVLMVLFVSFFLNDFAKHFLDLPRPSPERVRVLFQESGTGPGFPSGHAQHALVLWGALAAEVRRWWMTLLAVVLIAAISLSRIYLGLHFPIDVIGGLALGALILIGYGVFRRIARNLHPSPLRDALLAVALPLVLLALPSLFGVGRMAMADMVAGFLIGAGIGYLAAREGGMLESRSPGWRAPAKLLLGFAVVFGVMEGSGMIAPGTPVATMARYAVIGFTALWVVPWLARLAGLEGRGQCCGGAYIGGAGRR
ncbi:MAG TPA: phosphatase PAP2 family protein [Bacillota bacterium]